MDADEFECQLLERETPYVRFGDSFVLKRCPEMRWIYALDVNTTGMTLHDRPFRVGDRYLSESLTVIRV